MSIKIQQIDKKNYLVNQKPVFKEKKGWVFSFLATEKEVKCFFIHQSVIKTSK